MVSPAGSKKGKKGVLLHLPEMRRTQEYTIPYFAGGVHGGGRENKSAVPLYGQRGPQPDGRRDRAA
jgi:hypothetical protein